MTTLNNIETRIKLPTKHTNRRYRMSQPVFAALRPWFTSAVSILLLSSASADILYVNQAVTGGDSSGDSWVNAVPELGEALEMARTTNESSPGTIDEIWVAQGTYKPTHYAGTAHRYVFDPNDPSAEDETVPNTDRDKAFVILKDVKIYGGFVGTELITSERTLPTSSTILSGDIGTPDDTSDNCVHVVISLGDTGTALLDGVVVTGGTGENAMNDYLFVNEQTVPTGDGAGVCILNSDITLSHVTVSNNTAPTYGGGIFISSASPRLHNIKILGNEAIQGGGIMMIGRSAPVLTNVVFRANSGTLIGGGMNNNQGTPVLTNCLFTGNWAGHDGGGLTGNGQSILTNVTVSGNRSGSVGGGINQADTTITLRNCIVTGNQSPDGNQISLVNNAAVASLSSVVSDIFYDDLGAASTPAGITPEALFLNAAPAAAAPTLAGDYHTAIDSFGIDKGDNAHFAAGQTPDLSAIATDLDANVRIQGLSIDLGPYEQVVEPAAVGSWALFQ